MSKKEKLTREQKKEKQRAEYEAMSQKEKEFFDYNKNGTPSAESGIPSVFCLFLQCRLSSAFR